MTEKKTSVLLIDDDASLRILVRKILESADLSVDERSSVKEGIEAIQVRPPDVIILDLSMPVHDGLTLLRFRAQNQFIRKIPVLVLSSSREKPLMAEALALGANQYLEKPFEANSLLRKIRAIASSRDAYTYTFPADSIPVVRAELWGNIVSYAAQKLKIASAALFEGGKPVTLRSESFVAAGIPAVVGRVDETAAEVVEQRFLQSFEVTGMSLELKNKFEHWKSRP